MLTFFFFGTKVKSSNKELMGQLKGGWNLEKSLILSVDKMVWKDVNLFGTEEIKLNMINPIFG